jgi:hypothetical protein
MASGLNDTFRQVGIAVGIAAWGAIFLGTGSSKVEEVAAGTPAATGDAPRELVEAASSGTLDQAAAGLPAGSRDTVIDAAREGFLSGFNHIMLLGGIVAFLGAIVAVWLVREHEIERDLEEAQPEAPAAEVVPQPMAA